MKDKKDNQRETIILGMTAWLLPDMPSVQAQLKKVRRFMPYPNAMVVFEGNQAQSNTGV